MTSASVLQRSGGKRRQESQGDRCPFCRTLWRRQPCICDHSHSRGWELLPQRARWPRSRLPCPLWLHWDLSYPQLCLESPSRVVSALVRNFPNEVKISLHNFLTAVLRERPSLLSLLISVFWVGVREGPVHILGHHWGRKRTGKQQIRPSSYFWWSHVKLDPSGDIFNCFYSSGRQDSGFHEVWIRIFSLENWFLKMPSGYD